VRPANILLDDAGKPYLADFDFTALDGAPQTDAPSRLSNRTLANPIS
jgi:hypothetical protein